MAEVGARRRLGEGREVVRPAVGRVVVTPAVVALVVGRVVLIEGPRGRTVGSGRRVPGGPVVGPAVGRGRGHGRGEKEVVAVTRRRPAAVVAHGGPTPPASVAPVPLYPEDPVPL